MSDDDGVTVTLEDGTALGRGRLPPSAGAGLEPLRVDVAGLTPGERAVRCWLTSSPDQCAWHLRRG
ncbi:MAG: hypothetical protein R2851_21570 [Caldilineaceae bacterium]